MPDALNNDFDAERFAALIARFDTANASEAEAMNAARALRRMVAEKNMRIVDVMCRAEVMQALDALLKPEREESSELKAAFLEITKFAELAREQTELIKKLRRQVSGLRVATASTGVISGRLIVLIALAVLALMTAAVWH